MKLFHWRNYHSFSDVVEGCRKEERRAQTIFYERYKKSLKGICLRYAKTDAEADDILQEAFIKIFKSIDSLTDPASADSWVKTIVIRTAINYYHRTTKIQLLHDSMELHDTDFPADNSLQILDQLEVEVLLKIINSLPDGYRTIVNLYLIDGYSHREISTMLSIAEGTSKSQLKRGRNWLLKRLQEQGIIQNEAIRKES